MSVNDWFIYSDQVVSKPAMSDGILSTNAWE